MVDFTKQLKKIIQHPKLHARFLNTLSYLENCGAKLIARSEHPTMVPKEVLKHAAEEFRHAYFLKSQIEKVFPGSHKTYQQKELFGSFAAKHYLYRLNAQICRFLQKEQGITRSQLKKFSYLLVTYAIEVRAEKLYPLYQCLLKELQIPISMIGIIREEEQHLQEITEEMNDTPAAAFKSAVCKLEEVLFARWEERLNDEVSMCV